MTDTSTKCKAQISHKLLQKRDLEPCFWINEHVYTGYRPTNLPPLQYVKWIFQWNNETINIWTHLIGFIYFTWSQYNANFNILPSANAYLLDHVIITICIFGLQICMLLSSLYHIFGCISAEQRYFLLRMDVFGISLGLISIYVMGIYSAFLCFEVWQKSYSAFLLGLSLIMIYLPWNINVASMSLIGSQFSYAHLTYFIIVTLSLAPMIHWIVLHGGFTSTHVLQWLPNLLILYVLAGSAFIFHISMIPERFKHGTFDFIACSHQWWHVIILLAMRFWQNSSLEYLALHRAYPDYCSTLCPLSNVTK
ncbi:unnamed protein product [Thelazia callipaeda]|uniref:Progestin and adipoQ receptor family member 3 n=1 Tax=Thelazia callipaeda TaxID=103827 RepID=A0A0N5CV85_THECL|nr:unnamed protein product [Thelazia callipaeda]